MVGKLHPVAQVVKIILILPSLLPLAGFVLGYLSNGAYWLPGLFPTAGGANQPPRRLVLL